MPRLFRPTAAVLALAILAGCGAATPQPTRAASAVRNEAMTAQAAAKDAAAKRLVDAYRAIKGNNTAPILAKRLALIDKLGETDSDRAAEFLVVELERLDDHPTTAQEKLINAIVGALAELDEDEVAPRQHHEGLAAGESAITDNGTEARRKKRRFNVWDILRKYFKKKKRKSSGGGGTPPAPPAPPADGGM